MLVLIDESGCPGFKVARGSDPVFGIGMVSFVDRASEHRTIGMMQAVRDKVRHKTEFKFSACSSSVKDAFFDAIRTAPFLTRALIVKKEDIYSTHLRSDASAFYSYFVRQLVESAGDQMIDSTIRIDGRGSREFQRALKTYLREQLGEKLKDMRMADSYSDPLLQLADMCIGAITRAERQRPDAEKWKKLLAPRIQNIWRFK